MKIFEWDLFVLIVLHNYCAEHELKMCKGIYSPQTSALAAGARDEIVKNVQVTVRILQFPECTIPCGGRKKKHESHA